MNLLLDHFNAFAASIVLRGNSAGLIEFLIAWQGPVLPGNYVVLLSGASGGFFAATFFFVGAFFRAAAGFAFGDVTRLRVVAFFFLIGADFFGTAVDASSREVGFEADVDFASP